MTHKHPRYPTWEHAFVCDYCGRPAGQDKDEAVALQKARDTAKKEDWRWSHPGWGLTCPDCKKDGEE